MHKYSPHLDDIYLKAVHWPPIAKEHRYMMTGDDDEIDTIGCHQGWQDGDDDDDNGDDETDRLSSGLEGAGLDWPEPWNQFLSGDRSMHRIATQLCTAMFYV